MVFRLEFKRNARGWSLRDPTLRTKMAVIKNCQIFDIGDLKVFCM